MKIQTQYGEVHVLTNCPLLDSTERLEFKTEVHESFDGSEDRYIQRDVPRQVLSFNYVNMQKAMGDIFQYFSKSKKGWRARSSCWKTQLTSLEPHMLMKLLTQRWETAAAKRLVWPMIHTVM